MKHTPASILALANLLLAVALLLGAILLSARLDPSAWLAADSRWLGGIAAGSLLLAALVLVGVPAMTLALALVDHLRGLARQAWLASGISLALLLVPILWLGLGDRLASFQERRANRAWAAVLESMEAFEARFPAALPSERALEVVAAAAELGVELQPNDPMPGRPDRAPLEVRGALLAWVTAQARKADDGVDAPPLEASGWLSSHEAAIGNLEHRLLQGGPVLFETGWSSSGGVVPDIVGVRDVAGILVGRALERERQGDSRGASRSLEAAWRLGGAVRDRGEMLSQVLAGSVDGITLGAVRKLSDPPPSWRPRLDEADYRTSMLRGLQAEAWTMSADANAPQRWRRRRGWIGRVERPFLRLMAADFSAGVAGLVAELERADPCRADPDAVGARAESLLARWNPPGRIAVPSLVRAWFGAATVALEAELTGKVLEARVVRGGHGIWPDRLEGLASSVCPAEVWSYSNADGGASLSMRSSVALGAPAFRAAGGRD